MNCVCEGTNNKQTINTELVLFIMNILHKFHIFFIFLLITVCAIFLNNINITINGD